MTLDDQVRQLKERHAAATRARVRAEHDRDRARADLDRLTDSLRTDFGVSTVEEAKTRLAELHSSLAEAIGRTRTFLAAATGDSACSDDTGPGVPL